MALSTFILVVFALLASPLAVSAQDTGPIDTASRQAVAASYQAQVLSPMSLKPQWSGSADRCIAGSASTTFDKATLGAINWFRSMAGLPGVSESGQLKTAARATALMMEANNNISHYPSENWDCYSRLGAEFAAKSNLTLGVNGLQGVLGQVEDPGAWNTPLGHRRWLLFPRLESVGIANTTRTSVVAVLDDFGSRQTTTDWVAWPPAGFVPHDVIFPRWSLSLNSSPGANFDRANVTMTKNGQRIGVTQLRVANGYGDNTLAWEPATVSSNSRADAVYQVTVSNIIVNGVATTHSYEVRGFDPTFTPPTCLGRSATIVGSEGADVLRGTEGDDVIVALGGPDVIVGLGGNDIICAGDGRDDVDGGTGSDTILGGQGHDILRGGAGNDTLNGQTGRDRLIGNAGADLVVGGPQSDVLLGNTGTDECWGDKRSQRQLSSNEIRTCEISG